MKVFVFVALFIVTMNVNVTGWSICKPSSFFCPTGRHYEISRYKKNGGCFVSTNWTEIIENCRPYEKKENVIDCMNKESPNGCSVPTNALAKTYNYYFETACNTHDLCYGAEGETQASCDDLFWRNMIISCRGLAWYEFPGCFYLAGFAHLAVSTFVGSFRRHYAEAQKKGCWGQGVSCGNHRANKCSLCPQGNGGSWCNGDCAWIGNECIPVQVPDYIKVSSNGGAATAQSIKMGIYKLQDEYSNNFPVWKKQGEDLYLFVNSHKYWTIGSDPDSTICGIHNTKNNPTPVSPLTLTDGWRYSDSGWKTDNTIRIEAVTDGCFEFNLHHVGYGLKKAVGNNNYGATGSAKACQVLCQKTTGCNWFNWWNGKDTCWLKTGKGTRSEVLSGGVSGPRRCTVPEYIKVSSNGGAATAQSSKMGIYKLQDEYHDNFPVFKKQGQDDYLFVASHKYWIIGPDLDSIVRGILNANNNPTPVSPLTLTDGWKYFDGVWKRDNTIRIEAFTGIVDGTCYQDDGSRLLDKQFYNRKLTPELCKKTCSSKGYLFAGVQFSYQCFCGNNKPPASRIRPIAQCKTNCAGDASQKCGGPWRMNIYNAK